MLNVGWKPAACALLADELGVLDVGLNLQATA
jgi:hypothetical protein